MRIQTIDPTADPAWQEFIMRHPGATPFHGQAWAKVLRDTYDFQPRYIVAHNGDRRIEAGIPLLQVNGGRLVGLPFSDLCPPLLPDSAEGRGALDAAKRAVESNGNSALELRGASDLDLESSGLRKGASFVQHVIPLDAEPEELQRRYRDSVKRGIKKAKRSGLTVRCGTSLADMRSFYDLNVLTRKKHGLVPQPWRFFENIQRHIIGTGGGALLLCELDGRPVAADLLLAMKDTVVSKFNASDARFLNLRPNNLLLDATIVLAAKHGYKALHLGRTELEHEGLRRFKLGWGSVESPLDYYYYPPESGGSWSTGSTPAAQRLLGLFVRLAPLWALRMAGTALYRHAA